MNLKELPFPIRLYWDLTPAPDSARIDCDSLCGQIAEAKFFTLNLLDSGAALSRSCLRILERLKDEPVVIALTASRSALDPSSISHLSDLRVKELLVDVSSKDDLQFIAGIIQRSQGGGMTIGASVQVTADNYRDIPGMVTYCLEHGIARLVFPMQRTTGTGGCFYVSSADGKALSRELSAVPLETLKITIHDPFLWRIFYPAVSFPGGGCQAANSMAYIAPDGMVYPCPSMPIQLGDLRKTPLKTILSSNAKKDLVKKLRLAPDECQECDELSGCMGGCSGRVYELTGSLSVRDPACR